jgi:hypothetical protein
MEVAAKPHTTEIMTHFFGNETVENSKNVRKKGSQVKQDFLSFFIKTGTYLKSSLDLTSSH